MGILVITTGGTIGALAYEDPASPPEVSSFAKDGSDAVKDAVGRMNIPSVRCVSLVPVDSKEITGAYRDNILKVIMEAPEKEILVTHGTDRILGSAGWFYQQFKTNTTLAGRTIILTGAMMPLANGPTSDGYRNIEFALKTLANGAPGTQGAFIVLCDYDGNDAWLPRLYRYEPGKFEKVYTEDGRYNRLEELAPIAKSA